MLALTSMRAAAAGAPELGGWPLEAQVGAVLALSGLACVPFVAHLARRLAPGRRIHFARWGFTHLLQVVAVYLGAALLREAVWPFDPAQGTDVALLQATLVLALAGLAAGSFARRLSPDGLRALGFPPRSGGRALVSAVACYALVAPALFGLGSLWRWMIELVGGTWEPQDVALGFLELSAPRLVLAIALGVAVVPFLEELLFRGFLQPLLVQNFRDRGGVALTSFCFAALHGRDAFLPIFAFSLLLGGIKLRTQSLVACWTVHALHNALALALLLGSEDVRRTLF